MKKILSSLLCAVLLSSLLFGCASGDGGTGTRSGETDEIDFLGRTFVASTRWGTFEPLEEQFGTLDYDRTLYKQKAIEEEYNCVLKSDLESFSFNAAPYLSRYMAGTLTYDLVEQNGSPTPLKDFANSELIVPVDDFDVFDFSDTKHYGTDASRKVVTFYGHVYAINGSAKPSGGMLLFNKALTDDRGITDPQEMYEKKAWTFDSFSDVLLQAADTSDPAYTVYGMVVFPDREMLSFSAIFANGGDIVKTDESGNLKVAFTDPEALTALQWVADIEKTGNILHESDSENSFFSQGRATFYLTQQYTTKFILSSDAIGEFNYIPFPCGPSGTYGESAAYFISTGGKAILNTNEPEETAIVLDRWMTFEDYPEELRLDEDYERVTSFYSDASYENYINLLSSAHYNYGNQLVDIYYSKVCTAFESYTRLGKSIGETILPMADMVQEELDKVS